MTLFSLEHEWLKWSVCGTFEQVVCGDSRKECDQLWVVMEQAEATRTAPGERVVYALASNRPFPLWSSIIGHHFCADMDSKRKNMKQMQLKIVKNRIFKWLRKTISSFYWRNFNHVGSTKTMKLPGQSLVTVLRFG